LWFQKKCFSFYSIFKTSHPWERVGLDFVGSLPRSKNGRVYIIFCCDYLTKFIVASSTFEMTAETVVRFFEGKTIAIFEAPKVIVSNFRSAFKSNKFRGYMSRKKMNTKIRVPP